MLRLPLVSCALVPSSNKRYISSNSCSSITFFCVVGKEKHSLEQPDYTKMDIGNPITIYMEYIKC